jgi:hypothetical protein
VTPDEALRRVRDPHEVLSMTDVELTEAAVTLAAEVERLRAIEARLRDDYYSDKDPHGTLGRYLGEG